MDGLIGLRVVRGSDWKWGNKADDISGEGGVGTVIAVGYTKKQPQGEPRKRRKSRVRSIEESDEKTADENRPTNVETDEGTKEKQIRIQWDTGHISYYRFSEAQYIGHLYVITLFLIASIRLL